LQTGHVPSRQQVCDWHADSSCGSIVHLSRERIAPRDLEPNLSQTLLLVSFISKLAIFICKDSKRLKLSAQCSCAQGELSKIGSQILNRFTNSESVHKFWNTCAKGLKKKQAHEKDHDDEPFVKNETTDKRVPTSVNCRKPAARLSFKFSSS